jgi:palmitoyl transferase
MFRRPRWLHNFGSLCLALCVGAGAAHGERVFDHLGRVLRDGDTSLYLSGYAYHMRNNYSPRVLRILNEDAWGGGIGRTLKLKDGGVEALAVTAFKDSVDDWEFTLGYMREWRWTPFDGPVKLGAGVSAFLTSRPDFFDGIPFPAVLPMATITVGPVALITTYIPRLPDARSYAADVPDMNGDVIYSFARIDF